MPNLTTEQDIPSPNAMNQMVHVDLSKADVALIIDALLQAEMTLPLIDRRYRAMKAIEALREKQLVLADRLEDLMSVTVGELGAASAQPPSGGSERSF